MALTVLGRRNRRWERNGSIIDLKECQLRGAKLSRGTWTGANFYKADLRGAEFIIANLWGANLGGTNLVGAKNLTQEKIEKACQDPCADPPTLPDGLTWHGRICERYQSIQDAGDDNPVKPEF